MRVRVSGLIFVCTCAHLPRNGEPCCRPEVCVAKPWVVG